MSVEIAKKRGRPKKIVEVDGAFPSELPSGNSKVETVKKSTKPASKKSIGSKSKEIAKEIKTAIPKVESARKAKAAPIATRTSPKTPPTPKREPESPPPEILKAIAKKESSKILQQIAALKVEEELKRAAGLSTISTPDTPIPSEPIQSSNPLILEPPTIPSTQSTTMPSTSTPSSTFYQWLPNPPILTAKPHTIRALSTTSKLQSSESDAVRKAKALNRLATEASIPKAKKGLNPGGFPVTYKSATRRVTAIIVAAPIALCMSWFLYERLVLGVEQKKLVPDTPPKTSSGSTT